MNFIETLQLPAGLLNWVVLPVLIFFARIADVSLGTIRVIFISRGIRKIAPLIGFFEILIWIMAISQIMRNLQNIACYFAYAGGFAMGTYMGLVIEHRLSMGQRMIRIITKKPAVELIAALKNAHYGITSLEADGTDGKVHLIFTVVYRNAIENIIEIIKKYNPLAFYTVEDIRSINGGNFPVDGTSAQEMVRRLLVLVRKGK